MDTYIDKYCERLAPGLWAEPLNAVTNAAFFIAALCAWIYVHKNNCRSKETDVLVFLLCCIGAGSTLFHVFANRVTMLCDVLPILFYQIAFLWFYARGVIKMSLAKAFGIFALFIVACILADRIPDHMMNGSLSYAPAFIFLLGFGMWHRLHAQKEQYVLLIAAGVFAVSLILRTMDMAVCQQMPTGTHFLWHCLNGLVLYLTLRGFALELGFLKLHKA